MKKTRITSGALLAATLVALMIGSAGNATASGSVFVSAASRLTPLAVSTAGAEATYANLDAAMHSVTSVALKPSGKPLFDSGFVGAGEIVTVAGIEALEQGSYEYFCSFHPAMGGTLTILDAPST